MNIDRTSRSFRIVMIEIVLMLGIFAVMSTIIVRMFLSAGHMSKEALDCSRAVIQTENIAERLKGSDSFEAVLMELGMEKVTDGDRAVYHGYYGQDWKPSKNQGVYEITVDVEYRPGNSGHLERAEIIAAGEKKHTGSKEADNTLCRLSVSKFICN